VPDQLEILNSEAHKALRMHEQPGDASHFVMITIQEFPAAAAVCPIFFAKDRETGEFYTGALFGFREGELLVEGADRRDGLFHPLDLQRRGFFTAGENIAVDLSHPRFGADAPIALFDADGQPSNALRRIQTILGQLMGGVDATRGFIRELLQLKLIEPIDVTLNFDDGQTLQLDGLYTVTRDGLADLDDEQVVDLFRKGYLQAAHCMTFSLNQIAVLARRRNERLARGL
jgi:hypothetical protein